MKNKKNDLNQTGYMVCDLVLWGCYYEIKYIQLTFLQPSYFEELTLSP